MITEDKSRASWEGEGVTNNSLENKVDKPFDNVIKKQGGEAQTQRRRQEWGETWGCSALRGTCSVSFGLLEPAGLLMNAEAGVPGEASSRSEDRPSCCSSVTSSSPYRSPIPLQAPIMTSSNPQQLCGPLQHPHRGCTWGTFCPDQQVPAPPPPPPPLLSAEDTWGACPVASGHVGPLELGDQPGSLNLPQPQDEMLPYHITCLGAQVPMMPRKASFCTRTDCRAQQGQSMATATSPCPGSLSVHHWGVQKGLQACWVF